MPGGRKGFGWKRWSSEWLYDTLGLVQRLPSCVRRSAAESRSSTIGPITLDTKQTGKPSAGNPHAGFDVAGAGNGFTVRLVRHSQRKRGATDRPNLRSTAPVLDPTKDGRKKRRRTWGIDDESSHPRLCSGVADGVTRNIVCLFREPDAGNPPVRFDEREQETEPSQTGLRWRGESQAKYPPGDYSYCACSRLYSPLHAI